MKTRSFQKIVFIPVLMLLAAAAMVLAISNVSLLAFAAQNGMDIKEPDGTVVTGLSRRVYFNCPENRTDSSYDVCIEGNEFRLSSVPSGDSLDQWLAELRTVNPDLMLKYIWTSSDTSVADVSDSGKVQIYDTGKVILTCTAMADYGQVVAKQDQSGNYYVEDSDGNRIELYRSASVEYTFTNFSDEENIIEKDDSAPDEENFPLNGQPGAVEIEKTAADDDRYSRTGVTRVELSAASYPGEAPIDIVLVIDVSRSMTDFHTDYAMVFFKPDNIGSSVDSPRAANADGTYQYFEYYIPAEYKSSLDSGSKIPVYMVNPNGQDTIVYDIQYSSGRQNRGYNLYRHGESTSLNRQNDIANILNFNGAVYQCLSTFDAADEAIKNYTKLNAARDSAAAFVTSLLDASPKSRIALVQFADDGTKNAATGERYAINSRIVSDFSNEKDELLRLIYNVASDIPGDANYSPDRNAVDGAGLGYTGYQTSFTVDEHYQMEADLADKGITLSNYGGTNYGLGLLRAEEVLTQDSGELANDRRMVVFMTDGEPSTLNLRYSPSGSDSLLSDEGLDEYRSNSVFNRNNYSWAYFALRRPLDSKKRLEDLGYDIVTVGFDIDSTVGVEYFLNYGPDVGYNYYLTNEPFATTLNSDLATRLVNEGMSRQEAEAAASDSIIALRKQILKNLATYENGSYIVSRDDQTNSLEKVYEDLAESLIYKTTDAVVTDVIADDYELRLLPVNNGGTEAAPTIEITVCDRYASIDEDGNLQYTEGEPQTVERVTFSGSTLAGGITVTDEYLDENGEWQTRTLNSISSEPYSVSGIYFTYSSSTKTFEWTVDEIVNQKYALSYDAYLTKSDPQYEIDMGRVSSEWLSSGGNTDAAFADEADALNTNEEAHIVYNNYLNRECSQVFPKPTLGWENTSVTVEKVWEGAGADGASAQLRKSTDGGTAWADVYAAQAIGTTEGWSYTWNDLPLYEDGAALTYSVEERGIDDGRYTVSYQPDGGVGSSVTITNSRNNDVTVKYVTTDKVPLRDDELAYDGAPYGSDYDVRDAGSSHTDYLYPSLEKDGVTYYFRHKDTASDNESGELTGDKTIVYVYDRLVPPEIEKKIELSDNQRVESNSIVVEDPEEDYTVTYVIRVTNPNAIDMNNVAVADLLPAGLSAAENPAYTTGNGTGGRQLLNFVIPEIEAGETVEVSFLTALSAEAKAGGKDPIKNSAVIEGAEIIPVDGEAPVEVDYSIESNEVVTTTSRTFSVTKTVDKLYARKGDTLHYTLTVTNPLNHDLYSAVVSDALPQGVTPVDGTLNGGAYDSALHTISWNISKIAGNGGTAVLEFDAVVNSDSMDTLTNECTLVQGVLDINDDSNPSEQPTVYNKTDSAVTEIIHDPYITKSRAEAVAGKGEYINYTLTVTNPDTRFNMHNVVVTDTLPAGLSLAAIQKADGTSVSADGEGVYHISSGITAVYNAQTHTISWTIDEAVHNAPVTLRFRAAVIYTDELDGRSDAIWENTAYITEATPDVDGTGTPDAENRKVYIDSEGNRTNHSETVYTDTKYELVIEYRAFTSDGRELDDRFNAEGNRDTEYDFDDTNHVPETIIEPHPDGTTTVWVKRTLVNGEDLEGVYDSDKRIIVVYDEFDSEYSIRKQVRIKDGEWQDSVQVIPGTTVYFRILVSNNTNVPISGLKLSDEMTLDAAEYYCPTGWASALEAFDGTLDGKECWESSEMSFEVPENAAADSLFVNTATVSDSDVPDSAISDHADVTVLPVSGLSITKTAVVDEDENGNKKVPAGQRVAFEIVVSNTGNTTLTNVNVSDDTYEVITVDKEGHETRHAAGTSFGVIAALAPGEHKDYLVYFEVPEDSYVGQVYHNQASAKTYKEDGETVELSDTDDDTVIVESLEPVLSIVKTADKTHAKPGESVSYTIVVYNTGKTDAENVYVADYMLENGVIVNSSACEWAYENGWVIERVPANGSVSVTTEPIEWQMPLGIPKDTVVTNAAELYESEESYNDGDDPLDDDSVDVTTDSAYAIEVTKSANVPVLKPGDTAGYVIYVTNKSNAALSGITVIESLDGTWGNLPTTTNAGNAVGIILNSDNTLTVDTLALGDSVRLTFTYAIPEDAEDNSDIPNYVTVEADNPDDPEGAPVRDSSDATVRVIDDLIEITKTANCETTYPGSTVVYTITVTNTGDKELKNVVVTDDKDVTVKAEYVKSVDNALEAAESAAGSVDASLYSEKVIGFYPTLEAGECRVITLEYVVPADAIIGAAIINTATAKDDSGHEKKASDDVVIIEKTEEPTYKLEIVKTANVRMAKVGDTVTYTITVTNSGTGDLHNVSVTDSLDVLYGNTSVPAGNVIRVFDTIKAGSSESVIVNYTVPKNCEDKSVVNTATADSDETEPVSSNVTVTVEQPEIKITKTVSSQRVYPGEKVYYTLTVTNIGNVKLTDLLISDAKVGYSTTIPELDVGATWSTPANTLYYTFASNASSGTSFNNTASVSNGLVKAASSTSASVTVSGNPYSPNVPNTGDSAAEHNSYSTAAVVTVSAAFVCAVAGTVILLNRRKRRHA